MCPVRLHWLVRLWSNEGVLYWPISHCCFNWTTPWFGPETRHCSVGATLADWSRQYTSLDQRRINQWRRAPRLQGDIYRLSKFVQPTNRSSSKKLTGDYKCVKMTWYDQHGAKPASTEHNKNGLKKLTCTASSLNAAQEPKPKPKGKVTSGLGGRWPADLCCRSS